MNKRGISPLIATVLIIGFTVALAAIIITWGGRFIQDTQDDVDRSTEVGLACSKLNFEIVKVSCDGGTPGTCDAGACTSDAQCGTTGTCTTGACSAGVCNAHSECGTSGGNCGGAFVTGMNLDVVTVNSNTEQAIAGVTLRATNSVGDVVVDASNAAVGLNGFGTTPYTWDDAVSANPKTVEAIAHVTISGQTEVCQAGIEKVEATNLCGFTA